MPYEFDAAAIAYREAHRRCLSETGAALNAAQDDEAAAIEALIGTPANLAEIDVKLSALADLMQLAGASWFDRREQRLLASIRKDLLRASPQDRR
jgi:hypothetical protein